MEAKLEQDEAIYQAGKKAGIREVMEWLDAFGNYDIGNGLSIATQRRNMPHQDWQDQKKEWGINDG